MQKLFVFLGLISVFFLSSCLKEDPYGYDPYRPEAPKELEPDILLYSVNMGQIDTGGIRAVGGFYVINPNPQVSSQYGGPVVQSNQFIYSLKVKIKGYEYIDSLYYVVGDYNNKGALKSEENISLTFNQSLRNGQRTVLASLFIKYHRDSGVIVKDRLVEFIPESIYVKFASNNVNIEPQSRRTETLSFVISK